MPKLHSLYRESGKVRINPEKCKQCGQCAQICPTNMLVKDNDRVRVQEDCFLDCIACGHCMMVCPEGAVTVTGRGISPDDLLTRPADEKKAGADELAALMRSRRSVRRFKDQAVEPQLLERIVEMASSAPMSIPPWDIGCTILNNRDEIKHLSNEIIKGYQGFLKIYKPWVFTLMRPWIGRPKQDLLTHFLRPLAEWYVKGHSEGRDVIFYDAPALFIFHYSPYTESADATIACTYAMLAAESFGLGSTIIGGASPIIQRNKALSQSLGIPKGNQPDKVLILGHPATHFRKTIKRKFL